MTTKYPLSPADIPTEHAPLETLDFTLPPELEAGEPPEARGLARDDVRLMVSSVADDRVTHTRFRAIGEYLTPGDLLVLNTSGTLSAALPAIRADDTSLVLHLSTRLPGELWLVELRQPAETATRPFARGRAGETLALPAGGAVTLLTPYVASQRGQPDAEVRLWVATLCLPQPLI